MKVITLAAALEQGALDANTRTLCRRSITVDGRALTCVHPDYHRAIGPVEALAHSCNTYFATVARRLPRSALDDMLVRVGLGPTTPGVPLVTAALGLGGVRATPRALLDAFCRLADAGTTDVHLKDETRRMLRLGLESAARTGTASALAEAGYSGLAKTGTAPMTGGGYQGLVAAVVNTELPTHAIIVVSPGGTGAHAAALATEILIKHRVPHRVPAAVMSAGASTDGDVAAVWRPGPSDEGERVAVWSSGASAAGIVAAVWRPGPSDEGTCCCLELGRFSRGDRRCRAEAKVSRWGHAHSASGSVDGSAHSDHSSRDCSRRWWIRFGGSANRRLRRPGCGGGGRRPPADRRARSAGRHRAHVCIRQQRPASRRRLWRVRFDALPVAAHVHGRVARSCPLDCRAHADGPQRVPGRCLPVCVVRWAHGAAIPGVGRRCRSPVPACAT